MVTQGSLLLLFCVLTVIPLPHIEGLKCYICNNGMKGCDKSVSSKALEYLKECAPTAIACVTFRVEPKYTTVVWFQRDCLYDSDCTARSSEFGLTFLNAARLPNSTVGKTMPWHHRDFFFFAEHANTLRKNASLPELTQAPQRIRSLQPWAGSNTKIHTCKEDSCNLWDSKPMYPYAEGYPVGGHTDRIGEVDCYQCKVTDPDEDDADGCLDISKRSYYIKNKNVWFHDEDKYHSGGTNAYAYGCTTIAIYQTSQFGMKPYFERNKWVYGDHWCLLKKYAGSSERNLKAKSGTCREGYARALREKNGKSYDWFGHRVFHTVKEFSDYLKCRDDVRRKLSIWYYKKFPFPIQISFDEAAATEEFSKRNDSQPFAYVGFHFCGPSKHCNDEITDKKFYEMMENPPTTTTTTTTPWPTWGPIPTDPPTPDMPLAVPSTDEEEYEEENVDEANSETNEAELEDEDFPEIPDEGCTVDERSLDSGATQVTPESLPAFICIAIVISQLKN